MTFYRQFISSNIYTKPTTTFLGEMGNTAGGWVIIVSGRVPYSEQRE